MPLYVSNNYSNAVVRVPAGGGPASVVAGSVDTPLGIAVDAMGNVFVVANGRNEVVKTPVKGSRTTLGEGLNNPQGVAVDFAGNVYIADTGNRRVVKVPARGGPQTTVVSWPTRQPTAVAVDKLGNLFVGGDSVIIKISARDGAETIFARNNVSGLALDAAGNVFVADGNQQVVRFDGRTGERRVLPVSGLVRATGVALDQRGNLYVCDFTTNAIIEVPADGGSQRTVLTSGINTPTAIATGR